MENITLVPSEFLKLIPLWNGDKREMNLFLGKCEYVIGKYAGCAEQNMYMYHAITSRLTGNAAALVAERDDIDSWHTLKLLLIQHFGEPRNEHCMAIELQTLKINVGETYLQLCNRIQSIRSALLSKVNTLASEQEKICRRAIYTKMSLDTFLFNLPERLVDRIRYKNPSSLEEALAFVLEENNFLEQYQMQNKMSMGTSNKPIQINATPQPFKFGMPQGSFPQHNYYRAPQNAPFKFGIPPNKPRPLQPFGYRPPNYVGNQFQGASRPQFDKQPFNQFSSQQPPRNPQFGYKPPQFGYRPQQFGYRPPQQGFRPPQYGYQPPSFGQSPQPHSSNNPQFIRQDTSADVSMRTNNQRPNVNELVVDDYSYYYPPLFMYDPYNVPEYYYDESEYYYEDYDIPSEVSEVTPSETKDVQSQPENFQVVASKDPEK